MDNNPTVPAEAPQAPESVTTPTTNSNPEPAPSVTPYFDKMSESDRVSIDKFLANNGGIEAFNKWKQSVSNPQPKVETPAPAPQPAQPAPVQPVQQPVPPVTPQSKEGFLSQSDLMALQYRQMLVNDSKYSQIHDYIEKGDFIKDMETMGMPITDGNGYINDANIRRFLDLKAQTVPAQTANMSTASATPTVTYTEVGEKITSREDAMKVIAEAGHPMRNQALEYIAQSIGLKKATEEKK